VPEKAISVIPDEQEAIEAALRMGETGDLLLIFADSLVRSWKQITKFKPSAASAPQIARTSTAETDGNGSSARPYPAAPAAIEPALPDFNLEGLIRDERGVRMAPESDD
jgi:cyanophycin synthetase